MDKSSLFRNEIDGTFNHFYFMSTMKQTLIIYRLSLAVTYVVEYR